MTTFALKLIAISAMAVDHLGAVLFPGQRWMRLLGRLSMPLMCFLITEGFRYTRNPTRYLRRLFGFALLSELPFDLCFYGGSYPAKQNVFFTLALGLMALRLYDTAESSFGRAMALLAPALLGVLLQTDYGAYGVLLICGFYLLPRRAAGWCLLLLALNFLFGMGPRQLFSMLAVPLLARYNGQRGRPAKWGFYLFYPAHLLLLALIAGRLPL